MPSSLKLLPLLISFCVLGFLSNRDLPGRGYYGEHRVLPSLFISVFTAPYWSRLGDTKNRNIPFIAFLLGGLIIVLIEGTIGRNGEFFAPVLAGVVEGLFGGKATFYGASLTYAADFSSPNSLFPKFYVVEASFSLSLILSAFRLSLENCMGETTLFIVKLTLVLLMFPYVGFILGASRPQPILLEDTDDDLSRSSQIPTHSPPHVRYSLWTDLRTKKEFCILFIITVCTLLVEMLATSQLTAGYDPFVRCP
ncbi:hypothetical protein DL96DRAFT_126497 [Flagelloscypha sp. PMI_526]|nr:hypothetical protein DL96DRAFT_126497 [Flagelloscypha sp. PMI_526]